MNSIRNGLLLCMIAGVLPGFAPQASASDGVILISQMTATHPLPGCSPMPGYLITICKPGSYRLSTNLNTSGGGGVFIGASNVTLDLNGFALSGPGSATRNSVGLELGFTSGAPSHVTVSNGTIRGFDIALNSPRALHSVAPPAGLTVRGLIVVYGTYGIEALSNQDVLVEDSKFTTEAPLSVTSILIGTGLITRTTIDSGSGTGIIGGSAVGVSNDLLSVSNLF